VYFFVCRNSDVTFAQWENTAKRLFSDFNLGTRKNIDVAKFE